MITAPINMEITLTDQEARWLDEYLAYEVEHETLSNFSKRVIVNLREQLNHEEWYFQKNGISTRDY